MSSVDPEALREQVGQTSSSISLQGAQGWETFGINTEGHPDQKGKIERLSLTAVYRIPEHPLPKLHKAIFRSKLLPSEEVRSLEDIFARRLIEESASLGERGLKPVVETVGNALEETKSSIPEGSTHDIVAMLAIFNTSGNTVYGYTFAPTDLLDAIDKQIPKPPSPEEISETVLRDMYAAESERVNNIEPYDEWRQLVLNTLAVPRPEHGVAETQLRQLLLPPEHTHPTVSSALFT